MRNRIDQINSDHHLVYQNDTRQLPITDGDSETDSFKTSSHVLLSLPKEQHLSPSPREHQHSSPVTPSSLTKPLDAVASEQEDWSSWTYDKIQSIRKELGSAQWLSSLSNLAEQDESMFSDPIASLEQFVFRGDHKTTNNQEIPIRPFSNIPTESFEPYLESIHSEASIFVKSRIYRFHTPIPPTGSPSSVPPQVSSTIPLSSYQPSPKHTPSRKLQNLFERTQLSSNRQELCEVFQKVPQIYFRPSFTLSKHSVFSSALSKNISQQEKLSNFLDLVDVALSHQLAMRFPDLISALGHLNSLQHKIELVVSQIVGTRDVLRRSKEHHLVLVFKILKLLRRRRRILQVVHLLQTLSTVAESKTSLQPLIDVKDYSTLFSLMTSMESKCKNELQNLTVAKSLQQYNSNISDILNSTFEFQFAKVLADLLLSSDDGRGINKHSFDQIELLSPFPNDIGPLIPFLIAVLADSSFSNVGDKTSFTDQAKKRAVIQDQLLLCLGEWALGWTAIPLVEIPKYEWLNTDEQYQVSVQQDDLPYADQNVQSFMNLMRLESRKLMLSESSLCKLVGLLPQMLSRHVLLRAILSSRELVIKSFKKSIRSIALNEAAAGFRLTTQLNEIEIRMEGLKSGVNGDESSQADIRSKVEKQLSDLVPWLFNVKKPMTSETVDEFFADKLFRHQSHPFLLEEMPSLLSETLSSLSHDVFLLFYIRLWGFGLLFIRRLSYVLTQLTCCALRQEFHELMKNLSVVVNRIQPLEIKKDPTQVIEHMHLAGPYIGVGEEKEHYQEPVRLDDNSLDIQLLIEEYMSKRSSSIRTCEHLGMTVAQRICDIVKDVARATEAKAEGCLSRWTAFLQARQIGVVKENEKTSQETKQVPSQLSSDYMKTEIEYDNLNQNPNGIRVISYGLLFWVTVQALSICHSLENSIETNLQNILSTTISSVESAVSRACDEISTQLVKPVLDALSKSKHSQTERALLRSLIMGSPPWDTNSKMNETQFYEHESENSEIKNKTVTSPQETIKGIDVKNDKTVDPEDVAANIEAIVEKQGLEPLKDFNDWTTKSSLESLKSSKAHTSFTIPYQSKLSIGFTSPTCSLLYSVLLRQSIAAFQSLHEQRIQQLEANIEAESWTQTTVSLEIRQLVLSLFLEKNFWNLSQTTAHCSVASHPSLRLMSESSELSNGPALLLQWFESETNPLGALLKQFSKRKTFDWSFSCQVGDHNEYDCRSEVPISSPFDGPLETIKVSEGFLSLIGKSSTTSECNCLSSAVTLLLVVLEYLCISYVFPYLSSFVSLRLADLITVYNNHFLWSILGGAAVKKGTLRRITASHLVLSALTLGLLIEAISHSLVLMWLMASSKEQPLKVSGDYSYRFKSLPKCVSQSMGLSLGSTGWTAAVGPQGAIEVTKAREQLLSHQQKLWEKLSSLLTDRYETHACRWFSEHHPSISSECLNRLKDLEVELMNGKSVLLVRSATEREMQLIKEIECKLCHPHDAVRKFSKDVQQLLKVLSRLLRPDEIRPILSRALSQVSSSFSERVVAEASQWVMTECASTKQPPTKTEVQESDQWNVNNGKFLNTEKSVKTIEEVESPASEKSKNKTQWSVAGSSMGQLLAGSSVGSLWSNASVQNFYLKQFVGGKLEATKSKATQSVVKESQDSAAVHFTLELEAIKQKEHAAASIQNKIEPSQVNSPASEDSVYVQMLDSILSELECGVLDEHVAHTHIEPGQSPRLLHPLNVEEDRTGLKPLSSIPKEETEDLIGTVPKPLPTVLCIRSSTNVVASTARNEKDTPELDIEESALVEMEQLLAEMKQESVLLSKSPDTSQPCSETSSVVEPLPLITKHEIQERTQGLENPRILLPNISDADQRSSQTDSDRLANTAVTRTVPKLPNLQEASSVSYYSYFNRIDRFVLDCLWLLDSVLSSFNPFSQQKGETASLFSVVAGCVIPSISEMIETLLTASSFSNTSRSPITIHEILSLTKDETVALQETGLNLLVCTILKLQMGFAMKHLIAPNNVADQT